MILFVNDNVIWKKYWEVFNLLISKNIYTEFKTDSNHTLTIKGKKLYIQDKIINYFYKK